MGLRLFALVWLVTALLLFYWIILSWPGEGMLIGG
jgi:hypothetical protein